MAEKSEMQSAKELLELGTKQDLKRRARFVKSTIGIHDRTQVETIFKFSFQDQQIGGRSNLRPSYCVDAFFFFPVQLGVAPNNYSQEEFYHDLRAYLRLREPRLSYKEMVGQTKQDVSPLVFIRSYLEKALRQEALAPVHAAIEEAQVFGCSYSSYFLRRVEKRRRRFQALALATTENEMLALKKMFLTTGFFLEKGYSILKIWRSLHDLTKQLPEETLESLKLEIAYVNEYCSYSFRDGLFRLAKTLDDFYAAKPSDDLKKLKRTVQAYIRLERWYASRMGFLWIDQTSDLTSRERFVFRTGALKRRIWSVLYLNARPQVLFRFQKQIGPMIAAALAASCSLVATVFVWSLTHFQGFAFVEALSGATVAAIMTGLVVSYILKDRIKELGRGFFARGLFGKSPDISNDIVFDSAFGKKLKIGSISEAMTFRDLTKIPRDIYKLRKDHADELYEPEGIRVVQYSKVIRLRGDVLSRFHRPVRAVHDILRFSIESFLPRLDEPLHKALAPNAKGEIEETLMPKVYHLDLILRYSALKDTASKKRVIYDYFRLVLNKKGLTRIELLT